MLSAFFLEERNLFQLKYIPYWSIKYVQSGCLDICLICSFLWREVEKSLANIISSYFSSSKKNLIIYVMVSDKLISDVHVLLNYY